MAAVGPFGSCGADSQALIRVEKCYRKRLQHGACASPQQPCHYRKNMSIERQDTNKRMSQIVIHGDTVYLSGQVGNSGDDVAAQTRTVLAKIEQLLEKAGSGPEHILQAVIWLSDMRHFEAMNEIWDIWLPEGFAPARACCEARIASPDLYVEITVTAARK